MTGDDAINDKKDIHKQQEKCYIKIPINFSGWNFI
jgi:hypothetical protein